MMPVKATEGNTGAVLVINGFSSSALLSNEAVIILLHQPKHNNKKQNKHTTATTTKTKECLTSLGATREQSYGNVCIDFCIAVEALKRKYCSHFEKQEECRKVIKTLLNKQVNPNSFHFFQRNLVIMWKEKLHLQSQSAKAVCQLQL